VLWLWKDGSAERVVVALSGALAIIAPTDVVRLRVPRFARIYESVLGFLMRESEKVCYGQRYQTLCTATNICRVDTFQWRHLVPRRHNCCAPLPPSW
jgi:hypothetical protein